MRSPDDIAREVRSLQDLSLEALRGVWADMVGPPPKLRSPELLRHMLAWRLQAAVFGDLDANSRRQLRAKAPAAAGREAVAAGSRLTREWQGRRYDVEITAGGYVFQGRRYKSLSKIAREITGARWNGPRFFGLRQAQ